MKIYVYAICKNEEQFIERWVESMSEADGIFVLDTGSEDETVTKLEGLGVTVRVEKISPWRFDVARNKALEMVPSDADLCVCTDLDEVFHPGWREALQNVYTPLVKQVRYRYTWNFNPDGSEGFVFWIEKIHARAGFSWKHPVHEVLNYTDAPPHLSVYAEGVQLDHLADPSKSRAQYLPLLELSVEEDPDDDRNMHYLGREYMYYERWEDCIQTLRRHLELPRATWADERSASMRYIAKAYESLGNMPEAERFHLKACGEAPHLREPWLDFAKFLYRRNIWAGVLFLTERALEIQERPRTYICEAESWGSAPYDLAAIASWHLGKDDKALEYGKMALEKAPENDRLKSNVEYYKSGAIKYLTPQDS